VLASGALLLLLATAPGGPALASGFTTPEPGMLEELRRRHRPGQVLRVTSGVQRFELHAQDLDARGLEGITARGRSAPPVDPLPWSGIERIDILTNRRTYGSIMGGIVGGLGGVLLPAFPSGYRTDRPHSARNWLFGGALVGTFAGRALGARVVRERALYVAPVKPAAPVVAEIPPPAPAPDSGRGSAADPRVATRADTTASPAVEAVPAPSAAVGAEDPEVLRAVRRISSGDLLRIEGTFGRFHGYASQASAGGLSGLRAEPRFESVGGVRALTWRQIDRVDMRGASAGRGALRGAVVVGTTTGVLGALLGAAVASISGESSTGSAALAGAGLGVGFGGAVGALFGAAIGAGVPSWHNVYERP
jgi:hypothetical protein